MRSVASGTAAKTHACAACSPASVPASRSTSLLSAGLVSPQPHRAHPVSKGYSILTHHPNVDPKNMHRIVFDHLNARFPGKGEPQIEGGSAKAQGRNGMTNGALGATGTDYFQYCFREDIPEDVDLVLIEQGELV